jgi:chemotaxis protein histidine kinase CheA/ActR/RegA family two-component response regulator
MSNTFDKLSVLDSFIEEVNSYLPEIETNLERLTHSSGDMDALEETYRRTHTIGGSASMMDFPGLAHVAHGMEDILGDALDGITTLDEPALGLLRRSLGRLHQLLEGIRSGIDEEAVIAADDADYSRYRAFVDASTQSAQLSQSLPAVSLPRPSLPPVQPVPQGEDHTDFTDFNDFKEQYREQDRQEYYTFSEPQQPQQFDAPVYVPPSPSMPSFDEVLASFRTPTLHAGEDIAWPEEPALVPDYSDQPVQSFMPQEEIYPPSTPVVPPSPPTSSALDELVASMRQSAPVPAYVPVEQEDIQAFAQQAPEELLAPSVDVRGTELVAQSAAPLQGYEEVQKDAQTLEVQASALKDLAAQLREAGSFIEVQRSEFKGFLDGSKDALDRMEDWAGQAMGLNLRNSPEQVRRYLPLSVMWVANSKLKKVLDHLNQITDNVELTDEQMNVAFQQLQVSLSSFGEAFRQAQDKAAHLPVEEPGWTPWEMQIGRQQEALHERVTFERQGDIAAIRAEVEAQVRAEMRHEYEVRPVSLTLRAELEQQIRLEMRQEFEERRRLQERAAGPALAESPQELEARLRSEIEIQVRQEFLKQISANEREISAAQSAVNRESPSSVSNFADHASAATGHLGSSFPPVLPSQPPLGRVPAPTMQQSSFAADLGEEAAEIFRAEAEEHLQTISMHVAALEKAPQDLELIQVIRRATHTLKGAAGMMGFRAIADLSHVSEDLLDSIMEGNSTVTSPVLSLILDTAETLDILISGRSSTETAAAEARVQTLHQRYIDLLGEEHSTPMPQGHADEYIDTETDSGDDSMAGGGVAGVVADGQTVETNAQRTMRGELSVRVRLQKLDELVNLFGELLVNRSVLEERIQRLVRLVSDVGVSSNRLYGVGQKLESRFEAATLPSGHSVQTMPGEGDHSLVQRSSSSSSSFNGQQKLLPESAHFEEFDELELDRYTEFHQLARGLSEGISDMTTLSSEMDTLIREAEGIFARENRLNTTFQDRLMKIRLVPLSSMAPRLYRAARAVALKQGKDFEFLLEGEGTEVDRTVFEEVAGPLLHLIRNAVNHAIETPDIRIQKGKAPVGEIKLAAAYEGNQVVITVSDDGAGIDLEHVRNTAINRGLIRPDQMLDQADVLGLIFLSGFSTAQVLSEESGRGVGLDVVRDSVSRLRGTLAVDSTPGHGTSFIMKFPTTLAIQSAMMVKVAGQQFAIPTVMVEAIGRLDNFKRTTVAGQPALAVRNEVYFLNTLSQYLALPSKPLEEKAQVLLVNAGGHRVALIVEEIKNKQDIVTKNMGPHLRHVHGILGGTVLGNGRVVLILELTELLAQRQKLLDDVAITTTPIPFSKEGTVSPTPVPLRQVVDVSPAAIARPAAPGRAAPPAVARPERGKHILVVDDSPSVRRVVGNMLKQHGWEVQMARDGVEALEMISHETPAAVLLDIEMPRMDGYELTATVRAQEQYRTLPLVVLTSRAASKHQQRAMQLGASAYVVKPYQDEELLNTLNALVYGAVAR